MRKYYILRIAMLGLFFSCDIGSVHSNLSGHSVFWNDGIGKRRIYSTNAISHRTTIYGDVVGYAFNDVFIIAKQRPNKVNHSSYLSFDLYSRYSAYCDYLIDTTVFDSLKDKTFKCKVKMDSAIYNIFVSNGVTTKNTSEDIRIREYLCDSLIAHDSYYKKIFSDSINYWIIYNPLDSLIGPLTKSEYELVRKELNIPVELRLD